MKKKDKTLDKLEKKMARALKNRKMTQEEFNQLFDLNWKQTKQEIKQNLMAELRKQYYELLKLAIQQERGGYVEQRMIDITTTLFQDALEKAFADQQDQQYLLRALEFRQQAINC